MWRDGGQFISVHQQTPVTKDRHLDSLTLWTCFKTCMELCVRYVWYGFHSRYNAQHTAANWIWISLRKKHYGILHGLWRAGVSLQYHRSPLGRLPGADSPGLLQRTQQCWQVCAHLHWTIWTELKNCVLPLGMPSVHGPLLTFYVCIYLYGTVQRNIDVKEQCPTHFTHV